VGILHGAQLAQFFSREASVVEGHGLGFGVIRCAKV
jgi:hypothetical protein